MKPIFFSDPTAFRQWLGQNHKDKKELLVGFYKVKSGKPSMTWSESVDQALCFGWIDGVRKSIDDKRYTIRFTPRKGDSNWSNVNIRKMEVLQGKGLIEPAGQAVFEKRLTSRSGVYIFENAPLKLDSNLQKKFKAQKKAWDFFASQAPSYQKVAIGWIMSAKQIETRHRRFDKLLNASVSEKRLQ